MNRARQRLRIDEITQLNKWVRRFRLVPVEAGQKLAGFQPGQYLDLFYGVDGAATCRPYSITSSPRQAEQGYYELCIHGGGGFTSPWLFARGKPGMVVEASVPEGDFVHVPERDGGKLIAISGGMSVTPLLSMARAVEDGTLDADLTVFCNWDIYEDVLFYDVFRSIADRCARFRVVFALANEDRPDFRRGFVTLDMIRDTVDPENAAFFLCGPQQMYDRLEQELAPLGIPAARWHQEIPGEVKFGAPGTQMLRQGQSLELRVRLGVETRRVPMRSHETVLVALERAGIEKQARCRSGRCGYCASRLLSGRVFTPPRWNEQEHVRQEKTVFHPCCSFPLSDLEITWDQQ